MTDINKPLMRSVEQLRDSVVPVTREMVRDGDYALCIHPTGWWNASQCYWEPSGLYLAVDNHTNLMGPYPAATRITKDEYEMLHRLARQGDRQFYPL